ncbi:Uu.00g042710.m01.CDS01 [Anthostomella pinea]|uniref:Uu.00g042710.m01.CDS01 n=1 Tax=Anthostomella pinea TaxID=933095 RepID=A0AAI8VAR5_9PEZI|nr:Uu.00g042710.m01.CDS01 [Anthostomella pinea]
MFAYSTGLVALSALTLVSAQANSNSTFKIDPSNVTASDQINWCIAEQNSCSTLCGTIEVNNCVEDTLDFECECEGGNFPDMNLYKNTMPWNVCTRLQQNCIIQFQNDAAGQKNCTATYGDKCGTEDVADHAGEGSASTSTMSASSSGTAAATSTASTTSSSSTGAAAMPTAHMQYFGNGAAAVAVGLLAYAL